ncbi:nuclear transport factor 2 family protein [Dermacoccus abyssi]
MSQAKKAHIRRYYEVVDAADVEGVLDIFTPDATYRRPGYPDMVGADALRAFYEGERVIESGRHSVHTLVLEGDEGFVGGSFEGVLKNGDQVSLEFADLFRFAPDGKVSFRQSYFYAPLV